jgi:hypothetical protein
VPALAAHGELHLHYVMTAHADTQYVGFEGDASGFSVKLGDPLTFTGGSGSDLVPEPGACGLLAAGAALAAARAPRQKRSSTSTPIQSSSR